MKNAKAIKIISWILVALCMAVIFVLSAETGSKSEATSDDVIALFGLELSVDIVRTAAHFLEFAGLAALVFNALYWSSFRFRPFLSFAISVLYAVSDEVHQLFVEGRACQLKDIFIDSVGVAAGIAGALVLGNLLFMIKRRRSE